jgi:hypothetical protein
MLQAAKEIDSRSNTNSPIIGVFLHSHPHPNNRTADFSLLEANTPDLCRS